MASEGFQFKQFYIRHDKCAMKVGTDGVLLGCWAQTADRQPLIANRQLPIANRPIRVLDVGTGSGLIARMLMQRFPAAAVEAIDIDEAAVEQARENGVNAYLSSLQDWANVKSPISNIQYDLIVSNPPYFRNSLKNPDKGRQTARHTDSLSYEELMHHSARLLTEGGCLALVLPAEVEEEIVSLAEQHSLYLTHATRVYSKVSKPPRRVLLQFVILRSHDHGITGLRTLEDTLVLEDSQGGRSEAYQEITKDFYL